MSPAPRPLRPGDKVRDNLTGEIYSVARVIQPGVIGCIGEDEDGLFHVTVTRLTVRALPRNPTPKKAKRKDRR